MAIRDGYLAQFDHEMATTRRVLERVPLERADWAPHAKSSTLGHLAAHIAAIPGYAAMVAAKSEVDLASGDRPPTAEPTTREELLATFDANVRRGREAVAGVDDDAMRAQWTLRMGSRTVLSAPRVAAFRGFVLSHLVHHRGQMSVYLRLLDVPVPSIYGPTADEQ